MSSLLSDITWFPSLEYFRAGSFRLVPTLHAGEVSNSGPAIVGFDILESDSWRKSSRERKKRGGGRGGESRLRKGGGEAREEER